MRKKYQHLGNFLTKDEMKDIRGGTGEKTRWKCWTQPDLPNWVDYICYNGHPPCPYTCVQASPATCQTGDYMACVS